jgi:SAM-dependent MidA family methyltransferase
MNTFINSIISNYHNDLSIKFEICNIMNEMIDIVTIHDYKNKIKINNEHIILSETLNNKLISYVKDLHERYNKIESKLNEYKINAIKVRESFVIGNNCIYCYVLRV